MDLGMYNKHVEPRGSHGTLVGNWVEERALLLETGQTRHPGLQEENSQFFHGHRRITYHSDNADNEYKQSITASSYRGEQPSQELLSTDLFKKKSTLVPRVDPDALASKKTSKTVSSVVFGKGEGVSGAADHFQTTYMCTVGNKDVSLCPSKDPKREYVHPYPAPVHTTNLNPFSVKVAAMRNVRLRKEREQAELKARVGGTGSLADQALQHEIRWSKGPGHLLREYRQRQDIRHALRGRGVVAPVAPANLNLGNTLRVGVQPQAQPRAQ